MTRKVSISILYLGLILSLSSVFGQNFKDYWQKQKMAENAVTAQECKNSLKFCNEILQIAPHHPVVNYLAARLNALLGKNKEALRFLKKATAQGYNNEMLEHKLNLLNSTLLIDTAFVSLRKTKAFKAIIENIKKFKRPIHKSQVAFIISDQDISPEGITFDPVEKMFYLGSTNKEKIVRIDKDGNTSDFTKEKQDGSGAILGIHIDPKRRILWACSGSNAEGWTGIFKYNLSSGQLIKKYILSEKNERHRFNDLVINQNGDVYITDMGFNAIYMISNQKDTLELFLKSDLFVSPNGITLSDDEAKIYMADWVIGIFQIDIATKKVTLLSHSKTFNTYGVDGLYFADNCLYAIQDGLNRICRFTFDNKRTELEKCDIFETNTPYLDMPTTGVIVEDQFYFLANTQDGSDIQVENSMTDKSLQGIIIMKTSLK